MDDINDIKNFFNTRTIVFEKIPADINPEHILDLITEGDIEEYKFKKEKNLALASFFNYSNFYSCYNNLLKNKVSIMGVNVEISIGTPTSLSSNLRNSHNCGGTRCVYIAGIEDNLQEEDLINLANTYGELECVKIVKEKNTAHINFLNFSAALSFVSENLEKKIFSFKKIGFSKDRCFKQADTMDERLFNHTLYLGNISNDISGEELLNSVKGGEIFSLKFLRERKCAFLTFIDPNGAAAYLALTSYQGLNLKGKKIRVSVGNNSVIPTHAIIACYKGATRTLVISNIDSKVTHEKIVEDFGGFGELELINFISNKRLVFINFLSLIDCYNAYLTMKDHSFYSEYKLSFGTDRCSTTSAIDIMLYLQKHEFEHK